MSGPLAGRTIAVTRPLGASTGLVRLIEGGGGRALLAPAVDILPPLDVSALESVFGGLVRFDLAIFVSPTTVKETMARIPSWPGVAAAAVGQATAAALRCRGVDAIAPLEGADAEALLRHPALASVAGLRVVVFRGAGGRETLDRELAARGAEVVSAEVYRRGLPAELPAEVREAWRQGSVDAVTITSSEILDNLLALLGDDERRYLLRIPAFVIHPRIAGRCREAGFTTVIETDATDRGMLTALEVWFASQAISA